jgi:hypothetical protein
MTPLTIGAQTELDQFSAAIRDLGAFVIGLHTHAARGAVRVAFTFDLGGVEVLIGHEHDRPGQLVVIVEGHDRRVFLLDATSLATPLPEPPEHFGDAREALLEAIQQLTATTSPGGEQ